MSVCVCVRKVAINNPTNKPATTVWPPARFPPIKSDPTRAKKKLHLFKKKI